eukprot:scaffold1170_cov174-Amphora_coffeaeformis.AAC.24
MLQNSQVTPLTCQTTPSTRDSREWEIPVNATNEKSLSATSSPLAKQFRVLFSESESSSPLRVGPNQRAVSLPTMDDWKGHTSKLDSDVLHGNLSMDSSLTSSSSLCDENDVSVPMTNIPSTTNKILCKSLLWQWSRPRSLLFFLTALGISFSSFTFFISLSIRHPAESPAASERVLRERFSPRHVRQRDGGSLVSLTALAQGHSMEVKTMTLPTAGATERKKRRAKGPVQTRQRHETLFTIPGVIKPDDWNPGGLDQSFELNSYHEESSKVSSKPRIAYLHDPQLSANHHAQRYVDQYPSDFTDQTQLYSILDSGDERVKKMELRKPYAEGDCVPMSDWQTTFHPSCNAVHELGLAEIGGNPETSFDLFGKKGFWRNAWKVQMNKGNDVFVLKTLKVEHNFEEAHFEHDRVDAVAMERLTGSPHVIDIFGYCGHSVMTEYADGKRLGSVADKARKKPLVRLQMAADIAEGLADVHGIDGDDKVSFVHLDINPANVVIVGDRLKLNDFNIGIIRQLNTTSNEACGFPAQYPNPQWRSPEEARNEQNLTEKVDIFSLGHIFYRLISGAEPWNRLEPGGKPSKAEVSEKVQQGILPAIPESVLNTADPEIIAVRDAMLQCYRPDPNERPSAREIANSLRFELVRLKRVLTKISNTV